MKIIPVEDDAIGGVQMLQSIRVRTNSRTEFVDISREIEKLVEKSNNKWIASE